MFITPIPPTSSEIPAMLPSRIESVLLTSVAALMKVVLALDDEVGLGRLAEEEQQLADLLLHALLVGPLAVWMSICVTRRLPVGVKRKRKRLPMPLSETKT